MMPMHLAQNNGPDYGIILRSDALMDLYWGGGPEKVNKSSDYKGFKGIGAKRAHKKYRFSVNIMS